MVARGGASDSGHTRNPGETEEVMSAPEGAAETSVQSLRRPFQGSPPVVFSHPGFRPLRFTLGYDSVALSRAEGRSVRVF